MTRIEPARGLRPSCTRTEHRTPRRTFLTLTALRVTRQFKDAGTKTGCADRVLEEELQDLLAFDPSKTALGANGVITVRADA